MQETQVQSLGQEDLLEKEMATHSSTLAWKIPWMEEPPGRLQSMGRKELDTTEWVQCQCLIAVTREHWVEVSVLYRRFSLVIYFMHSSVYMEKAIATHSSVLAWRIPGMGKPCGLPSMGSHRVGHEWRNLAAAATVVYICKSQSPNSSRICFVQLWLYFCFVSKFICTIFLDSTYKQYHMILVCSWYYYLRMRRAQEPTPVFFPGGSHGQRNMAGKFKGSQRAGHS